MGKSTNTHAPLVRERTVPRVLDHARDYGSRRAAVVSVSARFGRAAQPLQEWVRRAEVGAGGRVKR